MWSVFNICSPCLCLLVFSVRSGHLVSGVHHGRDGKGQRHLPGHWPYPSLLSVSNFFHRSPYIKSPWDMKYFTHFYNVLLFFSNTFPLSPSKHNLLNHSRDVQLTVSCPLRWLLIGGVVFSDGYNPFNWSWELNWGNSNHLHINCPFLCF